MKKTKFQSGVAGGHRKIELAEEYIKAIGEEVDVYIFKRNRFTNKAAPYDGTLDVKCKSGIKIKLLWQEDEGRWIEKERSQGWKFELPKIPWATLGIIIAVALVMAIILQFTIS